MDDMVTAAQNQQTTENDRLSRLQEERFTDKSAETETGNTAAAVRQHTKSGTVGLIFMVMVGAAFDMLQIALDFFLIGPFVNWAVSLAAGVVFFMWTSGRKRRNTKGGGMLGWLFGAFAIELVPGFDLLPAWTVFTLRYAIQEKGAQA